MIVNQEVGLNTKGRGQVNPLLLGAAGHLGGMVEALGQTHTVQHLARQDARLRTH